MAKIDGVIRRPVKESIADYAIELTVGEIFNADENYVIEEHNQIGSITARYWWD